MDWDFRRLLDSWPQAYITNNDIALYYPGEVARHNALVKRVVDSGRLTRLRRGFYGINRNEFSIANALFMPSYISFHSALAFHGLIPEAVYQFMSASSKRHKEYITPWGNFIYYHTPEYCFYIGVLKLDQALIASPLKAIVDIYYHFKSKWNSIDDLVDDLRIEPIQSVLEDRETFMSLKEFHPSKRVRELLGRIEGSFYDTSN